VAPAGDEPGAALLEEAVGVDLALGAGPSLGAGVGEADPLARGHRPRHVLQQAGRGLSAAAPQGASLDTIEAGSPVLIDFAGVFDGYIVDMTRIFVIGTLAPELEQAFATAIAIQEWVVQHLVPGAICEELFLKAAALAEEAGLGRHFMGAPGENARFVGHGVGLELDEFPVLAQGFKSPLVAGQTIAIEPKFVFPGQGVVGIENTYAVGAHGGVKITDLPDAIVYL